MAGVPPITPVLDPSVIPVGKVPLVTANVYGETPLVTTNGNEYAIPAVMGEMVLELNTNADVPADTVPLKDFDAVVPAASVTVMAIAYAAFAADTLEWYP